MFIIKNDLLFCFKHTFLINFSLFFSGDPIKHELFDNASINSNDYNDDDLTSESFCSGKYSSSCIPYYYMSSCLFCVFLKEPTLAEQSQK